MSAEDKFNNFLTTLSYEQLKQFWDELQKDKVNPDKLKKLQRGKISLDKRENMISQRLKDLEKKEEKTSSSAVSSTNPPTSNKSNLAWQRDSLAKIGPPSEDITRHRQGR